MLVWIIEAEKQDNKTNFRLTTDPKFVKPKKKRKENKFYEVEKKPNDYGIQQND